jgi:hypothetical protein
MTGGARSGACSASPRAARALLLLSPKDLLLDELLDAPRTVVLHHFPLNVPLRFCVNARRPSFASCDAKSCA